MSLQVRCKLCQQIFFCDPMDTTPLVKHVLDKHSEVHLISSSEEIIKKYSKYLLQERQRAGSDEGTSTKLKDFSIIKPEVEPVKSSMSLKQKSDLSVYNSAEKTLKVENLKVLHPIKTGSKEIFKEKTEDKQSKANILEDNNKTKNNIHEKKYKYVKPISKSRRRKLYRTSVEKWRPGKGTIVCPKCGVEKRPLIKSNTDKVTSSSLGAACILTCWPCCFLPCIFPSPAKESLHCAKCNHFLGVYDHKMEVIQANKDYIKKKPKSNSQLPYKPDKIDDDKKINQKQKQT